MHLKRERVVFFAGLTFILSSIFCFRALGSDNIQEDSFAEIEELKNSFAKRLERFEKKRLEILEEKKLEETLNKIFKVWPKNSGQKVEPSDDLLKLLEKLLWKLGLDAEGFILGIDKILVKVLFIDEDLKARRFMLTIYSIDPNNDNYLLRDIHRTASISDNDDEDFKRYFLPLIDSFRFEEESLIIDRDLLSGTKKFLYFEVFPLGQDYFEYFYAQFRNAVEDVEEVEKYIRALLGIANAFKKKNLYYFDLKLENLVIWNDKLWCIDYGGARRILPDKKRVAKKSGFVHSIFNPILDTGLEEDSCSAKEFEKAVVWTIASEIFAALAISPDHQRRFTIVYDLFQESIRTACSQAANLGISPPSCLHLNNHARPLLKAWDDSDDSDKDFVDFIDDSLSQQVRDMLREKGCNNEELIALLVNMLKLNPAQRLNLRQVKASDYYEERLRTHDNIFATPQKSCSDKENMAPDTVSTPNGGAGAASEYIAGLRNFNRKKRTRRELFPSSLVNCENHLEFNDKPEKEFTPRPPSEENKQFKRQKSYRFSARNSAI